MRQPAPGLEGRAVPKQDEGRLQAFHIDPGAETGTDSSADCGFVYVEGAFAGHGLAAFSGNESSSVYREC